MLVNTSLKKLNLWSTGPGEAGTNSIAAALVNNTSLKSLDLGGVSSIDSPLLSFGEALINNTSLTECNLGNTSIEFEDAKALAAIIQKNTTLTELGLNMVDISPIALTTLRDSLNITTTFTRISVNDFDKNQALEAVEQYIKSFENRNQEKELLTAKATSVLKVLAPETPTEIANLISEKLLTTEYDGATLRRIGNMV